MSNESKSKLKNVKEFLFARGFYAALIICLVAGIVAIWVTVSHEVKTRQAEVNVTSQSDTSTGTTKVRQITTEGKSEQKTTSAVSENTTSSAEQSSSEREAIDTQVPYYSYYTNPVGGKVTKYFSRGLGYSKTMDDYRTHNGVDFEASEGEEVKAINKGTVVKIYTDELLGNVIEIDHAHSVIARYCGVKTELKEGDTVALGQVIGIIDKVPFESADSAHLHLEIIYNGSFVDPLELMGKTADDESESNLIA